MEHVIFSAAQLHDTCEILSVPVVITEQYPKALKHTVPEIDVKRENTTVIEKTVFFTISCRQNWREKVQIYDTIRYRGPL